ncbi:MAG: GTP 3',8-cyclase MoaA [Mogibacterium sp.]|nr:GTP 3',8-cyclase MoaA [Mogibacterium sp.]
MLDRYGRTIEYMRVSITDRCNMRCKYCMPNGIEKVSMSKILTYEEILRICEAATGLGIRKFKVTGGEPLVRLGCAEFIRQLKALPGTEQVTLTTNGMELEKYLPDLISAGLDAVNISLDSLDAEKFRYITGRGDLSQVLSGLDAAIASGIPVKVNCVLQKDFNDGEIEAFAELAFQKGIDVRFIELMPIGTADSRKGISNTDVLQQLEARYPDLVPDDRVHGNGPAVYYTVPGRAGGIGFISAMHGVFCSSCNRIRLTSQGMIKPCLCYEDGVDLRPLLAGTKENLQQGIRLSVDSKPGQHCFNEDLSRTESRAMSMIGG